MLTIIAVVVYYYRKAAPKWSRRRKVDNMEYKIFKKTVKQISRWEAIARLKAEQKKAGSAWRVGVYEYAIEILKELESGNLPTDFAKLEKFLLNGAENWEAYSYGGCSLISDYDIAERLYTASEIKRTRGGEREPNNRESWLDVQARAIGYAFDKIKSAIIDCIKYDYINMIIPEFLKKKEHKQGIREQEVISAICYALLENMLLLKSNKTVEFWKYHTCGRGTHTYYSNTNTVQYYTEQFQVIENDAKYKKDQKYIVKIDMRKSFFKKLEKDLREFINEED